MDNNISGATYDKRPGFKRMLRHAKEGRIDLILTKSVSRFARNSKELIEVVNQLKEDNVSIFFESENIDTSLNYNSLLLHTYAALAQDEIETNSQLVRLGAERKFIKGIPLFGNMYGYDIAEHEGKETFKINEHEAQVVRWIFEQFIGGKTYAQINRELISKGIETKKGNKSWSATYVRKIIMEIAYTGNKITRRRTKDLLTGKVKQTKEQRDQYYIMNSHPAIISEETYAMAQSIAKENGYGNQKRHKEPTHRPFSGRLTCGRCKGKFRAEYTDNWRCVNAFPSVGLCNAGKLKDKKLLQMSMRAFKERFDFQTQGAIKELIKTLHKINQNDHFEFHRLRYFAEIEIASGEYGDSNEKALELKTEYEEFEKKVSKIEDDRVFRDKALQWLEGIDSLEEFESTITVELARAWIASIEVYSEYAFIVRWIDEQETIIGVASIERIERQARKKEYARLNLLNENVLANENLEHTDLGEEVDALLETAQYRENAIENIVQSRLEKVSKQLNLGLEAIKLEPGLGIEDVNNLKKNLAKTKATSFIKENEKKLRVACYCRVSTHMEEQKVSLQTQIAYYTYLILKNPKYSYVGAFVDEGESGTSLRRRDDFNRMINEAKAGKIDLIITKSLSRFGRNVVDVLETIKTLRELPSPVHCYFEKENIHTADDKAPLLISLMSSVNQNEITGLSSSITWGIKKLAQRGIIHRTTDIYGYTIDKKRNWKIVPEEAEVIRWIAKEFISGKSIRDIIIGLNEKGMKSPTGNEYWDDTKIREMLRSEKYKGDYLFQKMYTPDVIGSKPRKNNGEKMQYYIENHHPAIIDSKDWDLIQEIFKKRSKEPVENPKALRTAGRISFYRKFFCTECGGVVSRYRHRSTGSREGSNWRCYNSYGPMIAQCQSSSSIRQEYIEYNFMKTLSQISESDEFRLKVEEVIDKLRLSQEERLVEKEIMENIEALNQQLYEAVDDEMAKEGHDTRKIDYLTSEIIKLQNELKVFTEREEKADCYKAQLWELLKACKNLKPLNLREYHNMDVRIEPGDSIYSTTKNAKDKTYIRKDSLDNFREDLFEKYVLKAHLDYEGGIVYEFVFEVNYGCGMKYQEYLEAFENAKAEINLEELLISKEVAALKNFCKQPRFPKEMREHLGNLTHISFDKRILKPLIEAGRLKLIRGKRRYDWRYYWEE